MRLGPETNASPVGEGIGSRLMEMPEPHLPVLGEPLANLLPAALGVPQISVNRVSLQPTAALITLVRPNYKRLFGARVRELRRGCHLTQDALAEHCGIFRTYLSRIELGLANPTLLVMVALANALSVEPCALLSPAALTLP